MTTQKPFMNLMSKASARHDEEAEGWTEDKLLQEPHADLVLMMKNYEVTGRSKVTKKTAMVAAIWTAMPLADKAKPKSQEKEHRDIQKDMDEYEANGGEVIKLKPQRAPKRKAPTQKAAEKNPKVKGRKVKRKAKDASLCKPRVKRIREDENITTLQSIIDKIGLKGSVARKALRASGIKKPGKQWCWPKDSKELENVQELMELTAGLTTEIKKSK